MKISQVIFGIIIGLFFSLTVNGQSNKNQLYYTSKHVVKPDKIEGYLEYAKKLKSALDENDISFSYSVWRSDMNNFYWFYPVDDYNQIEELSEEAWTVVPKIEPFFAAKFNENIDHYEDFFIHFIDSLTYNPVEEAEGLVYAEWWINYNVPMSGRQFRKAISACTGQQSKGNFNYPIGTLESDIGMPGGHAFIRVFWGTNPADLYDHVEKVKANLDEESMNLIKGLTPSIRKFEKIPFWYQKELSYTPNQIN